MADPIIFLVKDPTVKNDKELNNVWFEWREDKDEAASETAGHPVFDSVVVAHIMGPGMQRSEMTKIVLRKKPDDKIIRNSKGLDEYLDAFMKGDPGALAGTPLTELSGLDTGLIATLKAIGVHSVEALAAIAETAQGQFMGFRKYKVMAQAFLDQRAGQEPLNRLAAENERLKTELEAMTNNHNDLAARVAAMEDKPKRAKAA